MYFSQNQWIRLYTTAKQKIRLKSIKIKTKRSDSFLFKELGKSIYKCMCVFNGPHANSFSINQANKKEQTVKKTRFNHSIGLVTFGLRIFFPCLCIESISFFFRILNLNRFLFSFDFRNFEFSPIGIFFRLIFFIQFFF